MAAFAPEALEEYVRCFADPAAVHASCEDYRAGATVDDRLDAEDLGRRRIGCPVLALWGIDGIARRAEDPLAGMYPPAAKRSRISGSRSASVIALCRRATMSGGVPAGAEMPIQPIAEKPGNPCDATVGASG